MTEVPAFQPFFQCTVGRCVTDQKTNVQQEHGGNTNFAIFASDRDGTA